MMNSQDLETCGAPGPGPDRDLLLRDDAYGMIKWKQAQHGLSELRHGHGQSRFREYAQSYGARGHRPASAAEFAPLLRKTLETPGVDLIEVPIDYSDNDRILNREIKELSAKI